MKTDSVIMSEAMQALHTALTPVEVEKFVVMLNRDKFYTPVGARIFGKTKHWNRCPIRRKRIISLAQEI